MPIYAYAPLAEACPTCRDGLEILQRLADAPLTHCEACGGAIERVLGAPSVVMGGAHRLKESHVAKHGYTQYRRAGKGVYEKTAGKGPDIITGD